MVPVVNADDPVTFNKQVVRILQQHCQTCHRPNNIAPMSFLTYTDVRPWAKAIKAAVLTGQMPPWKPVNAHGVFKGERSLTDQEIQTLSQWATNGAPEGDPLDLPDPMTFSDTWSAGTPDLVAQPSGPYAAQTGSADIYRCFPMTVDSTSALYVRGYEVIPGNRAIVHDVLLFTDESGESLKLDDADPGPGYTCFGGAGFLNGLGGLGGWVPGSSPEAFPLGTGVRIPKGARIVMQVHYSLSGISQSSRPLEPDLTRVGIYLSPVPLQPISFLPVVNPFFTIPAGDSHYQVKASYVIGRAVELVAIAPHMHLLGRQATIEAQFPNGDRRQLIRIDNWDFHWQGNYVYRDPVLLPAGTLIELTAYYDNSLNNPKNPSSPPVPVSWGERTTDEMCLAFLNVKSPGVPSVDTVPFSLTDRGTNSVVTLGASGATQVGYARVTDSSSNAPSGLAIFEYRQNDILISEAGVPASRAMTQDAIQSGIAIANTSGSLATVRLELMDLSAASISGTTVTLAGNAQLAAFLTQIRGFESLSLPVQGLLRITSASPIVVTGLRSRTNERGDFLITTTPPVAESAPVASELFFPHFAHGGGYTTQFILFGGGSGRTLSGTVRFLSQSGEPLSLKLR